MIQYVTKTRHLIDIKGIYTVNSGYALVVKLIKGSINAYFINVNDSKGGVYRPDEDGYEFITMNLPHSNDPNWVKEAFGGSNNN